MSENPTSIGGQAVIEGVMMRSPTHYATAVRTPAGRIVIQKTPFKSFVRRFRFLNIPIIRGAFALLETLYIGIQSLTFSAAQATEDNRPKKKRGRIAGSLTIAGTIAMALGLGLLLFFYIPLLLTEVLGFENGIVFNVVDGLFRLVIFLAYIFAISRWKEMKRVFQYHGAEHMTIYAFESGEELTAENVKKYSTFHPRCGTSFLIVVMVVSVLVFIFLGRPETIGDRLLRFALIPLIAGISFEFIKLSGRRKFTRWFKPALWPGLALQRITTRPPTDDMLEVAIAALDASLDRQAVRLRLPSF